MKDVMFYCDVIRSFLFSIKSNLSRKIINKVGYRAVNFVQCADFFLWQTVAGFLREWATICLWNVTFYGKKVVNSLLFVIGVLFFDVSGEYCLEMRDACITFLFG